MDENCAKCDAPLHGRYWACDRTMHFYCDKCWPKTPCCKGKHGEGCATQIFDSEAGKGAGR